MHKVYNRSMFARVSAIALVAALGVTPAAAIAQTRDAGDASADRARTEAESSAQEEGVIVVTATRRAQNLQDVPLAVTAVSPAELDRQGVDNIQEVTFVAPSFSSSAGQIASGSVVLRIRGVGTTSNNIGFESAVGIFIDGAYQSRPGVALSEFVDIDQVEVLRGPQGTLFGRNTSAGALNITTKRPDLSDFGGFANATYGSFDEISVQGAVNLPIVKDTLALRVTGAYRQRDGFITLVDRNGVAFDDANDVDQFLVRGQLGFENGSGLRGRLIADYSKSKSSTGAAIELFQTPLVAAGAYGAVGLGRTGGNGQPTVGTTPTDQAAFARAMETRIASANFAPIADIDNYGVTGEVEIPLGPNSDLIFIGSYRKFESEEAYDSDFTALDIFNVNPTVLGLETWTAELRVQGEAFEGKLNYMVGGYFSDESLDQSMTFSLGQDFGENVGALLFPTTGGAFGANPLTAVTGVDPAGTRSVNRFQQSAQSYALFTHNSFELTTGLELTLGARYSIERKDGGFTQTSVNNQICPAVLGRVIAGAVPAALAPTFVGLGCFGFTAPANRPEAAAFPLPRTFQSVFDDEELIYTAKLGYEFEKLPVNLYASFTHGYKAGGINLDTTAAVGGANPTFRSEIVDAFEFGIKSRLLDNALTLNIAAFYEKFSDFQVLEFTGTAFQTFNVPKALSSGVEIESIIAPSDSLTFNIGATILDARYPDDCAGSSTSVTVLSLCGNDLTNAPNFVGIVGALWEPRISDKVDVFLAGQVRLESDQRTSTQAIVVPSAAAVTAAGSVQAAIAAAPRQPADIQDGTAQINLRAGIGHPDKAWQVEAFVNNLTDEVTRGVTFNTTLRGSGAANSRSAFTLQPRTYGITVRTRF